MSQFNDFFLEDIHFDGDVSSAPNGDIQTVAGIKNLKQALFNRLVTVKGSLAHRPEYGIGVKLYQNKISSLGKQRELALEIKAQFEQDFRVDKVESVSFKDSGNGLFIIQYKVNAKGLGQIEEAVNPFGDIEI
jgi:phage baseplate assembly protein W